MSRVRARALRRQSTDVERKLWAAIRDRQLGGAKFRRQVPIGRYIVDFICFEQRLVIELDGSQHADSAGDDVRTSALEAQGYSVLRFWNNEVSENLPGVLERILWRLPSKAGPGDPARASPHPRGACRAAPPSPTRGEGMMILGSASLSSPLAGEDGALRRSRERR